MLSAETASGTIPVEAVEMMTRIAWRRKQEIVQHANHSVQHLRQELL